MREEQYMRVMLHDRHSVSNHRRLDRFFNSLFWMAMNKLQSYLLLDYCQGIFPHKGSVIRKTFPYHYVIMMSDNFQGYFTGAGAVGRLPGCTVANNRRMWIHAWRDSTNIWYPPPNKSQQNTLYERHAVWSRRRLDSLLIRKIFQANIKENIKVPPPLPVVKGIHRWPMDSLHKGPVIPQTCSCHDVTNVCVFYGLYFG